MTITLDDDDISWGRELLALQGIEHDETVLSKYSESQLSDLAGNAWLGRYVTAKVGSC